MKSSSGEIVNNNKIGEDLYKIDIFSPYLCKNSKLAQFINIKCAEPKQYDPLLRRPFAIYDMENDFNVVTILYQLKGKGTKYLSGLVKGDVIDFCGPLGQPVELENNKVLLIGGGIGIAPLFFIARQCVNQSREVHIVAGFKDQSYRLIERDIMRLNINYRIYCEQENWAHTGQVVDGLTDIGNFDNYDIYCCGPKPMLKALQDKLSFRQGKTVAILEEWMACGVGVCAGCAVKIKQGEDRFTYKKVCSDGPAFNLMEVVFD